MGKKNIGLRIINLEQLKQASLNRRSVIVPGVLNFCRPIPAAVMMNMQGHILVGLFRRGMYLYEKYSAGPIKKGFKK